MATLGSRRGFADKLSLPLMILAFLVLGGFLYWLNITAQPTEVAIVEETDEGGPSASAILSMDDFLANPEGQVDAVVEVTGARVASRLGTQAFWIGADDAPYLVKMGPAVVEAGTEVLVPERPRFRKFEGGADIRVARAHGRSGHLTEGNGGREGISRG